MAGPSGEGWIYARGLAMENDGEAIEREEPAAGEPAAEEPAARTRRRGGFAIGAFLGLLTGAGLATLFTPVSGQEVRQRTAEKAPDLWRRRDRRALGQGGGGGGGTGGRPRGRGGIPPPLREADGTEAGRRALTLGLHLSVDPETGIRLRVETLSFRRSGGIHPAGVQFQ